jgi:hypothetical protein
MGCYPLFSCERWSHLRSDLNRIGEELVAVSLVTDPFGEYDVRALRDCFPDVVAPFKKHFVVDLKLSFESFVHEHHQRNARASLRHVSVEVCTEPLANLRAWVNLYATLRERHNIRGIAAFSEYSFRQQMSVPGIEAFRATSEGEIVGMVLWFVQDDRAYYHLGAYSERGYELKASFALFSRALQHFAERGLRWLNLGAGAGVDAGAQTGLTRFKQGWSNTSRTTYFCGRIFDRKSYLQIVQQKGIGATSYFPAYRHREFG